MREQEESERKKKEEEEAERRNKEQELESHHRKTEEAHLQNRDEDMQPEMKKIEIEDQSQCRMAEVEGNDVNLERKSVNEGAVENSTSDDADSSREVENLSRRKRSRTHAGDTKKITAGSVQDSVLNKNEDVRVEGNDPEVAWVAEGTTQRRRSFDQRPWGEDDLAGRRLFYDDSLESSETITYSSSSSTLTPTSQQQRRAKTEDTRRIIVKEKVEVSPT
jgi:hypothetical protein